MPTVRPTLNLGILAHVDAGKTSLTERLLLAAGVIDVLGSVDAGSTQTDSLELERRRGITIKSAVVSFVVDGTVVNLIDTPGHPDFIAEVERVLGVLDGVVLVVSAVEGVQAQTRVLFRTVRRLGLPVVVFVNKTDRAGADVPRVLGQIRSRLSPALVPLPVDVSSAADVLSRYDDGVLASFVDGTLTEAGILSSLRVLSRAGVVQAAYAGSAITGDGVDVLLRGLPGLLPSRCAPVDGPVSGVVFKVERGGNGEKIAYAQILSGSLRVRDRIPVRGAEAKVTAIQVFDDGAAVPRTSAEAGRIAKVWGLTDVRIGDAIGEYRATTGHLFAPPTLETVVVPDAADRTAVHTALAQLAEQDPLINLRQDDVRGELYLSLYGEVQKEVIQTTLAEQYGVDVEFRETTMICAERVTGVGAAVEHIYRNPFLATVGLRVEPGTPGSGLTFRLDVPVESMPLFLYKAVDVFRDAVEQTVRETLQQGLRGWRVEDVVVTLTDCDYNSPGTTAGDYRKLVPMVLMEALRQAGTVVCEPVHRLTVEGPADVLSAVLRLLAQHGATPYAPVTAGTVFELTADVRAAQVHAVQQRLPALTRGEGVLEAEFDHYRPVRGPAPERARTDLNPLHRKEYLLHVLRRV
ncbi:MAG: TetM/TetW/TetO/TetS family tetracycline resistance ribosomal protection protein [Hamadaea sp.]|nr:TetM/TetW/TetO/TetS family tetracycline resistance ribosomal protection protein [Hamadaea sp.]